MNGLKLAASLAAAIVLAGCEDGTSSYSDQAGYGAQGYYNTPTYVTPGYGAPQGYVVPYGYAPGYATPYGYEPGWRERDHGREHEWRDHQRREHEYRERGERERGDRSFNQPPQAGLPFPQMGGPQRMPAPLPPVAAPPPVPRSLLDANQRAIDQLGFRPSR